jgi:hypothetical protein
MDENSPSQSYLGYLKTEITIMGVLSAFTATAGAVGAEKMLTAEQGTALKSMWLAAKEYWILGFAAWLFASFLFYCQRSFLAFLYGQLAIRDAEECPEYVPTRKALLKRCDSWETWIHYRQAFLAIIVAVLLHSGAVIVALAEPRNRDLWSGRVKSAAWPVTLLLLVYGLLLQRVYTKFATRAKPWKEFFNGLLGRKSS